MQDPGDPTDVEETFETMSDPETHAELVSSPGPSGSGASESATRYWVVIHPAGTLHDPTNPELYLSLTLELLGWVLSRTVFRGRWSVRVVAAEPGGPRLRRTRYRRRVPAAEAPAVAAQLKRDIAAGRWPQR